MASEVEVLPSSDTGAAGSRYLNRELSLLDYVTRVLARAEDPSLPLLHRVRCLHFFVRNLDDFFQIRVAGLKEQLAAAPDLASPEGRTPIEQLRAIRRRVLRLIKRQTRLWHDDFRPQLAEAGIKVLDVADLDAADRAHLDNYFRSRIFPVLTPLAVDPSHPFPYISHFSLNLAVWVRDPLHRRPGFARLKVPDLLPRFVSLPAGTRFVPLEQVIAEHLDQLFPGMEVIGHSVFRLTRDNDLDVRDSEADDLLVTIQAELLRHRRRADAVRLEIDRDMPASVRQLLVRELELRNEDVYEIEGPLDLGAVDFLADLERPELKLHHLAPVTPHELERGGASTGGASDIFAALREEDVLVHHPYDSFASTVVAFIEKAADDPKVQAIKQTLYRTSGPASPIALALVRAAEAGKQVVALVELQARGDEQANIAWAQQLEQSGVHVVYGLVGLKTHAKAALVVRLEGDSIRRYVHLATGNYNPNTARGYEDLGLLSSDEDLGADVSDLFNFLTGYSRQNSYRQLLVAPLSLRSGLNELIRREAEQADGHIVIKVNNLTDLGIIDVLYEAAGEGVEIDLIVRGMCCLRPGVRGLSERIRVRSIVGDYLEHSRIFRFGSQQRGYRYYIGSPDMMDRNLDRRVEEIVPVRGARLEARLGQILQLLLADDVQAWELRANGVWHKVPTEQGLNAQVRLQELAQERAHGVHHLGTGGGVP